VNEPVVRLDAPPEAVRDYVAHQAARGLAHVLDLVTGDHERIVALTAGLDETQATTPIGDDGWSIRTVVSHLAASIDRSRTRIAAMSSGQRFVNPPVAAGQPGSADGTSFVALRNAYDAGMRSIIDILRGADERVGLGLTASHATYGPWNWLEWAVYSHHVHTHDHVRQLEEMRRALRSR
jgi:hypothetical protein